MHVAKVTMQSKITKQKTKEKQTRSQNRLHIKRGAKQHSKLRIKIKFDVPLSMTKGTFPSRIVPGYSKKTSGTGSLSLNVSIFFSLFDFSET